MIPALAMPILSAVTGMLGQPPGVNAPSASANKAAGADFSQIMAQMTGDAFDVMKTAETTSIAAMQVRTSAQSAVEAILAAERTLQTALAVRDKLVSAYQEITRLSM